MNATTARPTPAQFATLKALFADVIGAEVPGMVGLRTRMLEVHQSGQLTADVARDLINLLGDIVNPCNDDMPGPKSYAYLADDASQPALRKADPIRRETSNSLPIAAFTKGQIVRGADGQPVKVCQSKTGNLYGKVRDEYGTWEYAPGSLKGARHFTAEEAAEIGHATQVCVFCATPLSDPRSTEMGYGPICADHYGLPWG